MQIRHPPIIVTFGFLAIGAISAAHADEVAPFNTQPRLHLAQDNSQLRRIERTGTDDDSVRPFPNDKKLQRLPQVTPTKPIVPLGSARVGTDDDSVRPQPPDRIKSR